MPATSEFTTLHDVKQEFYKLFFDLATEKEVHGKDTRTLFFLELTDWQSNSFDCLVRYYKMGGRDKNQDSLTYFPLLTIQDFQPEIDRDRLRSAVKGWEGNFDFTVGSESGQMIPFAIPLNFRFQVSAVSKEELHHDAIQQWFMKNFEYRPESHTFLMHKVSTPSDGDLGIVVPYSLEATQVNRTDEYFEMSYMFELMTYVQMHDREEYDAIVDIEIISNIIAYSGG